MYDYAPMALYDKRTPESNPQPDWKGFSEYLVKTIKETGPVPVTEMKEILKTYNIRGAYAIPGSTGYKAIERQLKTLLAGTGNEISISFDHPSGERAETVETAWFDLTKGSTVMPSIKAAPLGKIDPEAISETTFRRYPALFQKIPKREDVKNYIPRTFEDMTDIEIMKKAFFNKENVLLMGPPGSGKTAAIAELAFELQLPYWRVELHGGISIGDIIGMYVPISTADKEAAKEKGIDAAEFVWQDGILTQMVRYGGIFVADEINAMPRELAMKLHGLLDHERKLVIPEARDEFGTQGIEYQARDKPFMFVAAMNPNVAGIHPLGPALKDRFHIILNYQYDPVLERKLPTINNTELIKWATDMRKAYQDGQITTNISTRSLEMYALNEKEFGPLLAREFLLNKFDEEERAFVGDAFNSMMLKGKTPEEFEKEYRAAKRKKP